MKKVLALSITMVVLTACGGGSKTTEDIIASQDLQAIKAKRTELVATQQQLSSELSELDAAILKLDDNMKIPLVSTVTVHDTLFKHYIDIQGSVDTKNLITIMPEFSGTLSQVYVKEGQKVRKGQLLAKIDDGGLSQQLAQLEIQAALAKTTYERQERLWKQNIGSEIQYLQAKSAYEAQDQAIGNIKKQLAKTQITAPFAGTIDEIITEKGNVVAPGQSQLMRIVNLNDMYIESDVPERYIAAIRPGTEVKVGFPVLGTSLETQVRQVGDFINKANRTFRIEVGVPNPDGYIKPNLTAKLRINDYSSEKALLIPQDVISEDANGQQYVYVLSEKADGQTGTVAQTFIKTGRSQGDFIEVLDGLKDGDEVLQEGARFAKDGQKVRIKNQ
jgi:RND family efflux transporter MFP subunit